MNSFADVARANASIFGGGARDLRLTMAYSYLGAPSGIIEGRLADDVDAHSLDAVGRGPATAETDDLMIHALGMGFAFASDLDPNRQPSQRNNNRGGLYEHSITFPTPKVLAAAGLGSGYQRTSTDTILHGVCPYLAVYFQKLALDLGEISGISTLLKGFWTSAGYAWDPAWDGGSTTSTTFVNHPSPPAGVGGIPGPLVTPAIPATPSVSAGKIAAAIEQLRDLLASVKGHGGKPMRRVEDRLTATIATLTEV